MIRFTCFHRNECICIYIFILFKGAEVINPDMAINLSRKNNPWGKIENDLTVDEEDVLTYANNPVMTSVGPCMVPGGMAGAKIK